MVELLSYIYCVNWLDTFIHLYIRKDQVCASGRLSLHVCEKLVTLIFTNISSSNVLTKLGTEDFRCKSFLSMLTFNQ